MIVNFVVEQLDLPEDRAKFLICLFACFPLGWGLRRLLFRSTFISCLYIIFAGLFMGFFCFGRIMWSVLLLIAISYSCFLLLPKRFVGPTVFIISMSILSYHHLMRFIYDHNNYKLDVSGCFMLLVQKLTYAAFEYQDNQKKTSLNPIKFLAFCLFYPSLLMGPSFCYTYFTDYIACYSKKDKIAKPKDFKYVVPMLCKSVIGLGLLFSNHFLKFFFDPVVISDPTFIANTSFLKYFAVVWYHCFYLKLQYYGAFLTGEGLCNSAFLGFNGFDEKGNQIWDYLKTIDIYTFETATSYKYMVDAWNIQTSKWLRFVCYNRIKTLPVVATFVLSAFWHGFYPGYYLSFIAGSLAIILIRKVRRSIRPHFLVTRSRKILYEIITFFCAQYFIVYFVIPFAVLSVDKSFAVWKKLYMSGHLMLILGFVIDMIAVRLNKKKVE